MTLLPVTKKIGNGYFRLESVLFVRSLRMIEAEAFDVVGLANIKAFQKQVDAVVKYAMEKEEAHGNR